MEQRASFTLLRLIHWIALVVLVISAGYALTGFMHPAMGFAVAAVLTFLLKVLVETTAEAVRARRIVLGVATLAGAVLVTSITVSLTAATLYAKVFAKPSAIHDWTLRRALIEREMQGVLALANTAHAAMVAWAGDAQKKAASEGAGGADGGGSCPNRPDTKGVRGPVYHFRADESGVATALAAELAGLVNAAKASSQTLVDLPKPLDFAAVKAGFEASNRAADDISRLTGGGSYASATVKVLDARRTSAIELPGGQSVTCGDSARLTHIERAATALGELAAVKAMPRQQPGVDVSDEHDVLSRSMLRSFNGVLAMVTLGRAGNFSDDALMIDALKTGLLNRETLAFVISIMAELAVVLTALLMVRQGSMPYPDNMVSWIDRLQAGNQPPISARGAWLGLARRMANLFYAQPTPISPSLHGGQAVAAAPAGASGTGTSGFGSIELFDDPLCREREAQWARPLLEFHFPWGDRDFIVIPIAADTRQVRSMAHALRAQGQFNCLSASAPAKVLADKPDVVAQMKARYGEAWRHLRFEVFGIGEAFAQLLRLQDIGPAAAAMPVAAAVAADAPWAGRGRHVPLNHRLAVRPGLRR